MTITERPDINWRDETTRRWITGSVARPQEGDPARCFYIDAEHGDEHGLIPVLVTADQPGYTPMYGDTPEGTWYWGPDYDAAVEICDLVNRELFGIDREESYAIVDSSMNAQDEQDAEAR